MCFFVDNSDKMCYGSIMKDNKGELGRWIKTMVSFQDYKALKKLAIDKDIPLARLTARALKIFLEEQNDNQ